MKTLSPEEVKVDKEVILFVDDKPNVKTRISRNQLISKPNGHFVYVDGCDEPDDYIDHLIDYDGDDDGHDSAF